MTAQELIDDLKQYPPNTPIHGTFGIVMCEAYWDGILDYPITDPKIKTYNIKGYMITDKGAKIFINDYDVERYIWENDGDISKIKINLDNRKTRKEWVKRIKKCQKEVLEFRKKWMKESLRKILPRFKKGETIVQSRDKKIGTYNCMYWKPDVSNHPHKIDKFDWDNFFKDGGDFDTIGKLCQGDCVTIINSGKFKARKKKFYIEWSLKND
jgi:hypothetical protein